ncbi:MAG: leucine-rich repeat domain-containing protein [Flavobacteriales bacterium]|nr:leucine-rich repeat domain-containing protein [Flavobacteriales bacterium]
MSKQILLCCFLIPSYLFAQDDILTNPGSYTSLTVDCRTIDCNQFFEQISAYTALESLEITNYESKKFPQEFFKMSQISTLKIVDAKKLNLGNTLKDLQQIRSLDSLSLEGVSANSKLKKARGISGLSVNRAGDPSKWIPALSKLTFLEHLSLADNNLEELPTDLQKLTNLKSLDLNNNDLTTLPTWVTRFSQLEKLKMESNLFDNPSDELMKFSSNRLTTTDIDYNDLTVDELKALRKKFPRLEIDEENLDVLNKEPENSKEKANTSYGGFNIEKSDLKVFSTAYLHYADLFSAKSFEYNFDTTLFDERYLDTSYSNTVKIPERMNRLFSRVGYYRGRDPYSKIELSFTKSMIKGQIWFDFKRMEKKFLWFNPDHSWNRYLMKYNREITAYSGMHWVFDGYLNKKEFKRKYIKDKKYMDVRIFYDESDNKFNMQLKTYNGFVDIPCHPLYPSKTKDIEESQKTYVRRNIRYLKGLDTRKKRFHRALFRDQDKYEKQLNKSINLSWQAFRRNYMSRQELEWTKEEWLEYYDKIIANEKLALYSAPIACLSVKRSLELSDYKTEESLSQLYGQDILPSVLSIQFMNGENVVPAKEILMVATDLKSQASFEGALGLHTNDILFHSEVPVDLIVELRNGDVGFIKWKDLKKYVVSLETKAEVPLKVISKKIGTVGAIRDSMGL